MTLNLELSLPLQRELAVQAGKTGKTIEALVTEILEREVGPEKTFEEILAPFRREFAESGMTETEWDALIEEAREEVWQEQRRKES